jgi:hypothetical protein
MVLFKSDGAPVIASVLLIDRSWITNMTSLLLPSLHALVLVLQITPNPNSNQTRDPLFNLAEHWSRGHVKPVYRHKVRVIHGGVLSQNKKHFDTDRDPLTFKITLVFGIEFRNIPWRAIKFWRTLGWSNWSRKFYLRQKYSPVCLL